MRNKKGFLKIPVMLRTLQNFLHRRLSTGHSLEEPPSQDVVMDHDVEFLMQRPQMMMMDWWVLAGQVGKHSGMVFRKA